MRDGDALFYDVSCSSYHGMHCPLAKHGYNHDGLALPSIVYGLLTDQEGRPLSIEAYPGNTAALWTVSELLAHLGQTGRRVVLAGDRGMLMAPQIGLIREMGDMGGSRACGAATSARSCATRSRRTRRCSTAADWRRSRILTSRASGSSCATIPTWPRTAAARASAPPSSCGKGRTGGRPAKRATKWLPNLQEGERISR